VDAGRRVPGKSAGGSIGSERRHIVWVSRLLEKEAQEWYLEWKRRVRDGQTDHNGQSFVDELRQRFTDICKNKSGVGDVRASRTLGSLEAPPLVFHRQISTHSIPLSTPFLTNDTRLYGSLKELTIAGTPTNRDGVYRLQTWRVMGSILYFTREKRMNVWASADHFSLYVWNSYA
jgi:hypothetical protein